MIEIEFAKRFIQRVTQFTDYNINVMDKDGIIIASRDANRVGSYHDVAYQIVHGNEDIVEIHHENEYAGVKPGINMVVQVDALREGVVGVTGSPEEIRPVALIIKMALEEMMKYELQEEKRRSRKSQKERLIQMLTQIPTANHKAVVEIAEQLGYSENPIRIPVLIHLKNQEPEMILQMIKRSVIHKREDISMVLDEEHILIFKTLNLEDYRILSDYKYLIGEYLSPVLRYLRKEDIEYKIFIGTMQNHFSQYYYSYQQCCWLEEHENERASASFFYDHAGEYLHTLLPKRELQQIFYMHSQLLEENLKNNFMEVVGVLMKHNYNFTSAAEALYIHKNTLLYRYRKIKDTLDIDLVNSYQDRQFAEMLYYAITN